MKNNHRRAAGPARERRWALRYTLGLSASLLIWLLAMLVSGRSLLWHTDAYLQQYTTLRYTAEAVRGLLNGQGLRMVDFSLGQGLDALSSLGFYGLTNPLYWLAALFTGRGIEIYYHALVFLYCWLEGLTFGLYAARTGLAGRDGWAISAGALMFALCGYNTAGLLKNPYFALGGICLCLMLWAVERYLRDGRWLMLTLCTLFTIIGNFYLGYQTLLMAAAYVVLRLAMRGRARRLRGTWRDGAGILGACAAGVLLSGFMLLPTLHAFLTSARSGEAAGYTASLLRYPMGYYKQLAACLFAPYSQAGYWTQLALLPWTAAGLLALLVQWRGRRRHWLRLGLLLALAGVCVPLAGKLMNGGGDVANRWSYGFAFACCLCATAGLRDLMQADFRRRRLVAALLIAWAAMMLALAGTKLEDAFEDLSFFGLPASLLAVGAGALLLVCVAVSLFALERRAGQRDFRRQAVRLVSVTLALCGVAYTAGYGVLMCTGSTFMKRGLDARIAAQPAARVAGNGGLVRVDTGTDVDAHASLLGYAGTGYYWSIVPATVSDYYADLEAPSLRWVFRLGGHGGDPYLDAAAAVGLAARADAHPDALPYGFVPTGEAGVYENRLALPLGVFFGQTLSEATYQTLTPLQKREALLAAAVLEGAEDTLADPLPAGEALPVRFESGGMSETGLSGREGDVATLRYDLPEGYLGWLHLKAPRIASCGNSTYLLLRTQDGEDRRNAVYLSNPEGNYYYAQAGAFLYLGEGGPGEETLALKLDADAEAAFGGVEVVALPAADYEAAAQALRGNGWSPEVSANRVAGRCTAAAPGVLRLAIPWLPGWRARVDGEARPLLRCNGMYCALALEAGDHDIELTYRTPLMIPGVAASGAGALLTLLALISRRRRA